VHIWVDADACPGAIKEILFRARLNMRDFMATLRDTGVDTGGAPPLSQADRQLFASRLDRMLAQT